MIVVDPQDFGGVFQRNFVRPAESEDIVARPLTPRTSFDRIAAVLPAPHAASYWKFAPGRSDQWGISRPRSARYYRVQRLFGFTADGDRLI